MYSYHLGFYMGQTIIDPLVNDGTFDVGVLSPTAAMSSLAAIALADRMRLTMKWGHYVG